MKKFALLFIVFTICAVLSRGTAGAGAVKIAAASWPGYSPAHVADAKGFWKAEGLEVTVATPSNPLEVFDLFKNRLVDVAFDMLGSVVQYRMEGIPAVILAETDWSHGGDKIVIRDDLSIKDIGKMPIGIYLNMPSVSFFMGKYLTRLDMRLADLRLIEMSPDELAQNFINGIFGMAVLFDPFAELAVRKGRGKIAVSSSDFPGCMPEGLVTMADTVQRIGAKDLTALFKGWIRAVAWSQDPANWSEYADILNTRTFPGQDTFSEEDLKALMDSVQIHDQETLIKRNKDGGGLFAYLTDLKAFLSDNNMLLKDFDTRQMVDNQAVLSAIEIDAP